MIPKPVGSIRSTAGRPRHEGRQHQLRLLERAAEHSWQARHGGKHQIGAGKPEHGAGNDQREGEGAASAGDLRWCMHVHSIRHRQLVGQEAASTETALEDVKVPKGAQ